MESNIIFNSNILNIKPNSYPIGESLGKRSGGFWWEDSIKTEFDKNFLKQIVDPAALRALRGIIKGTNTQYYSFSQYQFRIINQSGTCGYNRMDPCYGLINIGKGPELVCKCVNRDCPNFCKHRISPVTEEEISQFDPRDLSCVEEYGYDDFIKTRRVISDTHKFDGDIGYESAHTAPSETDALPAPAAHENRNIVLSAIPEHRQSYHEDEEITHNEEIAVEQIQEAETDAVVKDEPSSNIFEYFTEAAQTDIIEASPESNIFVDAGPGTGKTYTLIHKLNYMVTECDVNPEGIMVLCFTNAAVDVIKKRLKEFVSKGANRGLLNIDIRTFHSFSWWLISQANELFADEGWKRVDIQRLDYNRSLDKASEIMRKFSSDVVGCWEHFIVDEVQDLTNSLGNLVLEIINACISCNVGVTILGDACQAIYDYKQYNETVHLTSDEFYKKLFKALYGKANFWFLKENHRQGDRLLSITNGLREAILSGNCSNMRDAVSELIEKIDTSAETNRTVKKQFLDECRGGGTLCLLLRNNGQTRKISSDFHKKGIEHKLNVAESLYNYVPWLSDIFSGYGKENISYEYFEDQFKILNLKADPADIWSRFQILLHSDNDVLNVRELLDAIAYSRVDDPSIRVNTSNDITISNIHRAKGREYDSVIIDKGFMAQLGESVCTADEYKTLYVAITRPKKKLIALNLQENCSFKKVKIFDTRRDRWGSFADKTIKYLAFGSSEQDIPIAKFAYFDQKNLTNVNIDDPVYLERILEPGNVKYKIMHEPTESCLGVIDINDSDYLKDIRAYLKIDPSRYVEMPSSIDDLYISGVYSQLLEGKIYEPVPELAHAAPNGIWKWLDISGMGHLKYDIY